MIETPVCRHFTSCLDERCAAGVVYRNVVEIPRDARGNRAAGDVRWPCVRPDRPAWDTEKPEPECEHKSFEVEG